ncbi:MAG: TldD/PmbA family protein, partial [Bacteroidales bacterium]
MNEEIYNLAKWSVDTAKTAGADDCKAGISRQRSVNISYRDRKPESIKEASSMDLFIEIFVNGRYSGQSTSDLRKESLDSFISNAVATTKLLAEDPYRTLPDPKYYEGRADTDLEIVDPAYEQFSPDDRHNFARMIENACLETGGEKTISVTAGVQDSHGESVIITSNGFEGMRESTFYRAGAQMAVKDEGDRRPQEYHYIGTRHRSDLPDPVQIGNMAAKRTLDLLGGKKIKTETLPIIIENRNVPRVAGGFLSAMFGGNIQQKQSFLADKKDQPVASEHFTLIDDPHLPAGMGSQLFDGDGFASRKRTMIESGVLKEFFIDWYYSQKLGWEPTTGGPSNLILPPGNRSVEDIMKDLGRGILVTGFIGGNSNSTTGDFSIGIYGKLFENGIPVQTVVEMNIAGNHLEFWDRLVEVANDPWIYSS